MGRDSKVRAAGCDEFARFAQAGRCVEQEHARRSSAGFQTDGEVFVAVPFGDRVGDPDLLDSEVADVAEEVRLADVRQRRPEDRLGDVPAAPESVVPVRDRDPAQTRS